MPHSSSAIAFSALSFVAGVWAFVKTQEVTKETFEPILAACTSKDYATMEEFVEQSGFHAYDKRVGFVAFDVLVCLITQFLLDLTQHYPAGLLSWGAVVLCAFPAGILCNLEAGRQKNRGLILWPTAMGLLYQMLGISVIFPALWVPAYTWGSTGESGSVPSLTLAKICVYMNIPAAVFLALVFYLETDTDLWTTCAGILGGPGLPLSALLVTFVPAPKDTVTPEVANQTFEASALSYRIAGVASFVAWVFLVYTAFMHYGTDYNSFLNDLWFDANPCVKFMSIDSAVLWIGLILHIGSRSVKGMVSALAASLVFGPGAACCMALASMEMDRTNTTTGQAKKVY